MNNFEWISNVYLQDENFIFKQDGISLLDGSMKSGFNNGSIELTTHRIIWYDPKDVNYRIGMKLDNISQATVVKGGIGKPNYIQIKIQEAYSHQNFLSCQSPVSNSTLNTLKMLFKKSGESGFYTSLNEILNAKPWVVKKDLRSKGILGIERTMQNKSRITDKNIEMAFSDLDKLMNKAQMMVGLCKQISQKISQNEEFSTDEAIQFKSYLLSMGISDPVNRRNCSSSQVYYEKLALQISNFLLNILPKVGGFMSSVDLFCRINRARGLELLSPEDLIESGKLMNKLKLPVVLKIFDSGVMVFQLASLTDEKSIDETLHLVISNGSLTADKFSRIVHIPPILAKERLLLTENSGKLCRDDTVEGLRFFENKF